MPSILVLAKSICYYSITDLQNTASISISDNFNLDHRHWVSHSQSKCQALLYKAARYSPQSPIRPLFSPLFLLSHTIATYHPFSLCPPFASRHCSSPPSSFSLSSLISSLCRSRHRLLSAVPVPHCPLAPVLLPLPFHFPAPSLPLWPSSHHRFVLHSTLGSSDFSSPPSFSFPRFLSLSFWPSLLLFFLCSTFALLAVLLPLPFLFSAPPPPFFSPPPLSHLF